MYLETTQTQKSACTDALARTLATVDAAVPSAATPPPALCAALPAASSVADEASLAAGPRIASAALLPLRFSVDDSAANPKPSSVPPPAVAASPPAAAVAAPSWCVGLPPVML